MRSGNPPESIIAQLAAMDFDINKKDTQEGDDMVDQSLPKPKNYLDGETENG